MSMFSVLSGKDHIKADTPWNGWSAFFMAMGFVIFQLAMAVVLAGVYWGSLYGLDGFTSGVSKDPRLVGDMINLVVLGCEISAFAFALFVIWMGRGKIKNVLLFRKPVNFGANLAFALVGLLTFYLAFAAIISLFFETDAVTTKTQMEDLFSMLLKSDYLWAGVMGIVIGAPFFEETVFRGFLLTGLLKSGIGFWWAAVISSALWAIIHAGYAPAMLGGLFGLGLMLALVVRKSGSIWLAILMHAIWNGVVTYATISTFGAT